MAGICGYFSLTRKTENSYFKNTVSIMNDALYESSSGFMFSDDFCAIGKSDNYSESDNLIVFFFGDLYNGRQLSLKHGFSPANEADLILNGYERLGVGFLRQLSGRYVFVIYSKHTKTLSIVRDRVGSKPMYYYKSNELVIFGTELKGLMASGIVPEKIDKAALSQFLQLTYIPSPSCIIKDVNKVKPAVILSFEYDGTVTEKEYWNISHSIEEKYSSFEKCKAELKDLLYASVREKLELYPNNGALLSGGFDSSIVVGVMSDISSAPIKTFTVGYNEKQFDESNLASVVSNRFKTCHSVLKLDWETVSDDIDTVLNCLDEPYADSSLIATYAVCKLAKQKADVVFMGDSGDELFAGYNKYLISYYGDKYKKIPKPLRKGLVEPIIKLLPRKSSLYRKISKVISSADMPIFEQRKRLMCLGFKAEELVELMCDKYVDRLDFIKENYSFLKNSDEQTRAQYIDFKTVLEGDMLPKTEIASKLSGIKTCAPILDNRIIDFAYSIPTEFKISKKNRKIILKETFRHLLPKELFTAPKHGFEVPVGKWLEAQLKERLLNFSNKEFLEKQGLFNYDYISKVIEEHLTHKRDRCGELFAFFVFQSWYSKYINL